MAELDNLLQKTNETQQKIATQNAPQAPNLTGGRIAPARVISKDDNGIYLVNIGGVQTKVHPLTNSVLLVYEAGATMPKAFTGGGGNGGFIDGLMLG